MWGKEGDKRDEIEGGIRKRGRMSRGWGWMTRGGRRRGRRGSADLTEIMISILLQWLLSLSFGYWWWGDVSAAPWCRAGKKGMKWRCVWKWTVLLDSQGDKAEEQHYVDDALLLLPGCKDVSKLQNLTEFLTSCRVIQSNLNICTVVLTSLVQRISATSYGCFEGQVGRGRS